MNCPACGEKITHYNIDGAILTYVPCGCNLANTSKNRVLKHNQHEIDTVDEALHYFEHIEEEGRSLHELIDDLEALVKHIKEKANAR
jgi:hypothetical protein